MLVSSWQAVLPVEANRPSHSFLPVASSKHSTCSRDSRYPEQAVTYTLPPAITGLDSPLPGSSAFQRSPSVLLHLTGRSFSVETAEPPGPRNCVQSPAQAEERTKNQEPRTKRMFFLVVGKSRILMIGILIGTDGLV